ncbi:MAG: insulinase family protein [bacterium]|nr:insulinase family protein [bacterium]
MNKSKKAVKNSPISSFRNRFFKKYPVYKFRLDNGLDVLIQENHELPIISLYTLFKVGSRNERPGITGISHLFEHMMFNGSRKFGPKEFDVILESGGGHSNAYTSHDLTVYYEDFDSSLLETVLDLESDRMGWLDLSEKNLVSERGVVMEERRLRTDDSVFGRLEEELYAASYQCHPYRWPVIGWMSDIANISLEDCKNFFHSYYSPNNAAMVLSGDLDTDKAVELINKYYGGISRREIPDGPATVEPDQKGEKRHTYKKNTELDSFIIGYHIPGIGDDDLIVLDVLQTILADGDSSILQKDMVRKKELALNLYAGFSWQIDPGLFTFVFQMRPGCSYRDGDEYFEKLLGRLKSKPVNDSELNKAMNILEADFINGLQTNNGRTHRLGLGEVMLGGYRKLFDPVIKYRQVTTDDIQRVINKYFHPDNKTIIWLESGKES